MTAAHSNPGRTVGVARRLITPGPEVELAGLGYYLNRTPERVREPNDTVLPVGYFICSADTLAG